MLSIRPRRALASFTTPVLKSVEAGGVGMPYLVVRDAYAWEDPADLRALAARPTQTLHPQI
jgi:hypothetical protein